VQERGEFRNGQGREIPTVVSHGVLSVRAALVDSQRLPVELPDLRPAHGGADAQAVPGAAADIDFHDQVRRRIGRQVDFFLVANAGLVDKVKALVGFHTPVEVFAVAGHVAEAADRQTELLGQGEDQPPQQPAVVAMSPGNGHEFKVPPVVSNAEMPAF
jgi:hypothetical protein